MRRRKYLAGVTGSFSAIPGCVSGNPIGQGSQFNERVVSLVEINDQPTEMNLELSVSVVEPKITRTHTAGIKLTIENTGSSESPGIGIEVEGLDHLAPIESDYGKARNEIMLVPKELKQPEPNEGCWTTKEAGGPWNGSAVQPEMTLKEDTDFTQEYRVWDPSPQTPCMPVGEYRFGKNLSDVNEQKSGWMFTLSLEK